VQVTPAFGCGIAVDQMKEGAKMHRKFGQHGGEKHGEVGLMRSMT
jgi:hypothetical protein